MVKEKETGKNAEILNVGLVGHIDHGKTTLLQKLSGKWADTHSEELKRGITIRLGYADVVICKDKDKYNIEGKGERIRQISFIDAPGHEILMATMLSGAALIDVALLVIAANEGIKPQTREHLMALQVKSIKKLIVVQNKIDLVDEAKARENYNEIKEFLKGSYDDSIIIPVSAQQGVNVDMVLKALCEVEIPARDKTGEPIFVIARSFDINRPGTAPEKLHGAVLGGSLKKGILKIGDEIEIKPGRIVKEGNKYRYETINTKVKGLFRNEEINELTPGGSSSIETELDMVLGKSDSLAGNLVSLKGKLPSLTEHIKIKYTLFPEVFGVKERVKVEPIKVSELLLLSINTSTGGGSVASIKNDEINISLKMPVIAFKGDNVGIARNVQGHWRLIGSGVVV